MAHPALKFDVLFGLNDELEKKENDEFKKK